MWKLLPIPLSWCFLHRYSGWRLRAGMISPLPGMCRLADCRLLYRTVLSILAGLMVPPIVMSLKRSASGESSGSSEVSVGAGLSSMPDGGSSYDFRGVVNAGFIKGGAICACCEGNIGFLDAAWNRMGVAGKFGFENALLLTGELKPARSPMSVRLSLAKPSHHSPLCNVPDLAA